MKHASNRCYFYLSAYFLPSSSIFFLFFLLLFFLLCQARNDTILARNVTSCTIFTLARDAIIIGQRSNVSYVASDELLTRDFLHCQSSLPKLISQYTRYVQQVKFHSRIFSLTFPWNRGIYYVGQRNFNWD